MTASELLSFFVLSLSLPPSLTLTLTRSLQGQRGQRAGQAWEAAKESQGQSYSQSMRQCRGATRARSPAHARMNEHQVQTPQFIKKLPVQSFSHRPPMASVPPTSFFNRRARKGARLNLHADGPCSFVLSWSVNELPSSFEDAGGGGGSGQ